MSKHGRSRRHASDPNKPQKRHFFREYQVEIAILSLFGFGIFLLLERLEIKQAIYLWMRRFLILGYRSGQGIWRTLLDIEKSDMVGIGLIVVALYLILLRFRVRISQFFPQREDCPRCESNLLRRVPRSLMHRALKLVLNVDVRRYECRDCGRGFLEMKSRSRGKANLDDPGLI